MGVSNGFSTYEIIFYNTKHINLGYHPSFDGMNLLHRDTLFQIYSYMNNFYILLNNVFYVKIDPISKKVIIFGNISDSLGDSFFHQFILTPVIELIYRIEGFFTLHAGGICKNNTGYLIFGKSGMGKTLNTLKFIEKSYRFLGDDTIIIDKNNVAYAFLKPLHLAKEHLKHLKKIKIEGKISPVGKSAIGVRELLEEKDILNSSVKISKLFFLRGFSDKTEFLEVDKGEIFKRILAYSFIPLKKYNQNQMDIIKNLSNIPAMDVYLKKGEYLVDKI